MTPDHPALPITRPQPSSTVGTTLRVGHNGRYFETEDGRPFFYLADTAWTLFKRFGRNDADRYFRRRAAQGFTAIQAYLLRGLDVPNLAGELTLVNDDPTRFNEAFFQNVDHLVAHANECGLVMGLVATMGEHVLAQAKNEHFTRPEQVFTRDNAFAFGELLGHRYRERCVVWFLGGDRDPSAPTAAIWDAMALGLKAGCGANHLISYHGARGGSSSAMLHRREWLDFNAVQSGHYSGAPTYSYIEHDYALVPRKPTLDMEARYEDHIDNLYYGTSRPDVRIDAHQVREAAYWAVFAGAAGHGYGHNSVWQRYEGLPGRPATTDYSFPVQPPTVSWVTAMDSDGAVGMGYLRALAEQLPWHELVPDQAVIAAGQGEGEDHVQAARSGTGRHLVAYLPHGGSVSLRTDRLESKIALASWYDPRAGTFTPIGEYPTTGVASFVAPTGEGGNDWVLLLSAGH